METTLLVVKPDAVARRHIGAILGRVEDAGFDVTGIVMRRLTREDAARFYEIHRGKEFFDGLVEFMTSGPVVAVLIRGTDVRIRLRQFVGLTDPSQAARGTIRADFGTSVRANAVHASNPDEDVAREVAFYFPGS